jgi:pyruvate dehydrogenase E2 component (dihydrolipoamide acetyltransferase)
MPTPVIMPKFEMTQETGKVLAWLKNEGQMVEKGEPLLEVETDKVNQEVEAPASGILAGISAPPGQVVPIATPIAYILKPGETLGVSQREVSSSVGSAGALAGASAPGRTAAEDTAAQSVTAVEDNGHAKATPLAVRLAESNGIDLSKVVGTGPLGRITKEDVEASIAAASAPAVEGKVAAVPAARRLAKELDVDLQSVKGTGPEGRIQSVDVERAATQAKAAAAAQAETRTTVVEAPAEARSNTQPNGLSVRRLVPLTNIRKTIAERMTASVREAPQFTVSVDVDMRRALSIVEDLKATATADKPKVTLTTLIVKACAWALRQHPEVNASFQGDAIAEWDEVNVGVATAIDSGLIVPVVKAADTLGLRATASQLADLSGRAREGRLKIEDLQGGTFTVSNLGMFGIDRFEAILNPPQAAILAVGRVAKRAEVTDDDKVEIRPIAALALTSDHRVLDGASAAKFLATLKKVLEHPGLFLE